MKALSLRNLVIASEAALNAGSGFDTLVAGEDYNYIPAMPEHKNNTEAGFSGIRGRFRK